MFCLTLCQEGIYFLFMFSNLVNNTNQAINKLVFETLSNFFLTAYIDVNEGVTLVNLSSSVRPHGIILLNLIKTLISSHKQKYIRNLFLSGLQKTKTSKKVSKYVKLCIF